MQTVQEFAEACRPLGGYQIYMLFEEGISEDLRDRIFYVYADPDLSEPVRAALNSIGAKYSVPSLINW